MRALALGVMLCSALARADQCQVVTPAQATLALQRVVKYAKFVEYCEPCGDPKPGEAQVVDTVEVKPWSDPSLRTVVVNGKEEDLAYLFVQKSLGDSHYLNVAVLSKCEATGISREIDLDRFKAPGPKPVKMSIQGVHPVTADPH